MGLCYNSLVAPVTIIAASCWTDSMSFFKFNNTTIPDNIGIFESMSDGSDIILSKAERETTKLS